MQRMYEWQGWAWAQLARLGREARGQGTVEYVGLILLVAAILAVVVAAGKKFAGGDEIAKAVGDKIKTTVDGLGGR